MLEQNWKSLIHFSASADNHFDPHKYSKLCGGGTWRRGGWHRWRGAQGRGQQRCSTAGKPKQGWEAGHRQALYVTYIAARGTNFLASKRHRQKAITQVFLFALVIFRDSIQFTFSILIFLF